jgi:putative ABC transport system permease protein
VRLGGESHEIVGVMPPGFRPVVLTTAELWRARQLDAASPSRGAIVLRVVARLRDGLSVDEARSAASVLARQLEQKYPESNARTGINIVTLHDQVVGDIRLGLLVLAGAVGFVLLIACVNIANLLLARASARTREIAVRLALGAARRRVVRQLLTESVLLASVGGALGLLLAVWGIAGLVAVAPDGAPRLDEIGLNASVLAFSVALTLVTGILFGLVPALQASGSDVTPALREGGRGGSGPAGRGVRRALIIAEVGIALVLLVGSGLLMQTLARLQAVDLGFDPTRVLVGFVVPPQQQYATGPARTSFYDSLLERVSALPGVEHAALSSVIPLGGDSDMTLRIEGRPLPANDAEATTTWYRLVSADYLRAMSIGLLSGRGIAPREPAPVVVVNETGARRFWPGESPLGKRVRFSDRDDAPWFTVVGVAEDVKMRGARGEARAEMYLPYWQLPEPGINIVLKTVGEPHLLAGPLRQAVREVDPDVPVSAVSPMADIVSGSVAEPRFFALLVGVFAALALTLAGVGIYGVMSYAVVQRRAEIGVRMALGAGRSDVFGLVVMEGVRLAAIGAAVGFLAALGLSRAIGSLLYGVAPRDPLTFGAMTAVLLAVAGVASLIPAMRAARVDPMVALRAD